MIAAPKPRRARRAADRKPLADSEPRSETSRPDAGDQSLALVPIDQLQENPFQPRINFDEQSLNDLAASIRHDGLLHPIIGRPARGGVEIIDGHRRKRACAIAGLAAVQCIIRCGVTDRDMIIQSLASNDLRAELNALERAAAYQRAIDSGMNAKELSLRLGRNPAYVSFVLVLLRLPDEWKQKIARGEVYSTVSADLSPVLDDRAALAEIFARVERLSGDVSDLSRKRATPLEGLETDDYDGSARRRVTKAEIRAMVKEAVESREGKASAGRNVSPADTAGNGEAAGDADPDEMPPAAAEVTPEPFGAALARAKAAQKAESEETTHAPGVLSVPDRARLTEPLDESALSSLKRRWLDELLTREIEKRGLPGVLRALGIDVAEVWSRELASPFTHEYFGLKSQDELSRLAEELGVYVKPGAKKPTIINQLIASANTKKRLPAELAI